jgi:hypothetical protein
MVSRHAGTLPVLLTSAHGAPVSAKPPGVSQRTGSSPGCPPAKLAGDGFTRQITTAVAQLLLETLGEAPYVVIAEYHRKFIDANRSGKCAFNASEARAARPLYAEYHQTIRTFIDEIQAEKSTERPRSKKIRRMSTSARTTANPSSAFLRPIHSRYLAGAACEVCYKPPATSFHRPDRAFPRPRRWTVDSPHRPTAAPMPTGWMRCSSRSLSRSARMCLAGKLSLNILGERSRA